MAAIAIISQAIAILPVNLNGLFVLILLSLKKTLWLLRQLKNALEWSEIHYSPAKEIPDHGN